MITQSDSGLHRGGEKPIVKVQGQGRKTVKRLTIKFSHQRKFVVSFTKKAAINTFQFFHSMFKNFKSISLETIKGIQ